MSTIVKDKMRGAALFSEDGKIRWKLTRSWGASSPVCWIMCNPSNADAMKGDPTVSRCINFTAAVGFHTLVIYNIYPWVSSDPKEIAQAMRDARGNGNFEAVATTLRRNEALVAYAARKSMMTIAAWGNIANFDRYTSHFATEMQRQGITLHCLAETRDGTPMHPLARGRSRIPDDVKPTIWREAAPTADQEHDHEES